MLVLATHLHVCTAVVVIELALLARKSGQPGTNHEQALKLVVDSMDYHGSVEV